MVEPHWRSPPRERDVGAAIAAVASGSPEARRPPTAQLSPQRRRYAAQQEYEELAVALDRHAARARALAEELACRRAGDDWRPLLAPLVTFQTSLLDMHHSVLDAISDVASRSVGHRGSPLGLKHESTSVSSSSPFRQLAEASTSTPSRIHNARGLRDDPSSEPEQRIEIESRIPSDEAVAGLFFGRTTKQPGRMELLHTVGSMLRRKRDKLLNDGNGHMTEKVREIEEDIARVELELVMRSPVDTPQKRRVEANTSVGEVIATDGKTPSQGSTATPQSQTPQPARQMAYRETSPSPRRMPLSGQARSPLPGPSIHRSRSPSPINRISKSEFDFSDTPRPVVLCSQKDGPEMHDEFDAVGEEPISKADSVMMATEGSHSTPQSDNEFSEVSLDSLEVRHDGSSMQAALTDIVSPLPPELACDTTEELISEKSPPSEKDELLIRQRDTTDAVLIGSARHVGDDIRLDCSSERRGRSARRCMAGRHCNSDQSEAQTDISPQIGGWWHDRPERPEWPAWRWGGDMGNQHAEQHHALETSSPHSSDSPVLPSASEILYEDTHMANSGSEGSLVVPSRRSPLRSLPPPWAFQGDSSLVIPATSSAASVAESPVDPNIPTAKSTFRGKENMSPPPPMAPSHILPASPSVPLTKPPPKAPPLMVDIVASLTRSSSTPGKRFPATSVGASACLFHKTPSPRPHSRQRTSPGSAPAGSLVLQPRSLLFGSPSPHRYVGVTDQDPLDWMSPIRPIRPVRHCRDTQPDTDANDDEKKQSEAYEVSLPLPLPSALSDGDWRPAAGSPVRLATATTGSQLAPTRISVDSPARVNNSPAKVIGSPARLIGSPALLGLGNSPARTTTPVRPYLRSPSAPSLVGSPASSCGARDSGGQRQQRSVGVALGSGDTPRNLTDWRKSLQMAKRQDERPSHKKTPLPWR